MADDVRPWHVTHHPSQKYAFFISHVAEDTEEVKQLKSEIAGRSGRGGATELSCFLDYHNWELGNDNRLVIRENLRKSEFMIAWVTPSYLRNPRGWVWFELYCAELLESSLNEKASNYEVPFIVPVFRGVKVNQVERTPLLKYWQRSLGKPGAQSAIGEIGQLVVNFYVQELRKRSEPPPTVPI